MISLAGITNNLQAYDPMMVTLDHACQYVRAMYTSDIAASLYDPDTRELSTSFSGDTDMATMFYLFTDQGSTIQHLLVDVPLFSGTADVLYTIPGPLDHIVVTPNPTTVVTGATQAFSAEGYDADSNLIPNLDFTWSVVGGGAAPSTRGAYSPPGWLAAFLPTRWRRRSTPSAAMPRWRWWCPPSTTSPSSR